MRMLAVFEKSERIRHIGHLDIQRSVQRGLRRSGLPVAYSNGFNPHILISFASALSTGASGKREIMDVTMAEPVTAETFVRAMNSAMPPALKVLEARALDDRHPAMMSLVRAARYDLAIDGEDAFQRIRDAIPAAMAKEDLPAMRKTKTTLKECNIRPLIHRIEAKDGHLLAVLTLNEKESCKPGILLEAMCREAGMEEVPRMTVVRLGLLGEDEQGRLVPLETV
ncbi:MAG: TIGR03936 family radical SAM-associated protein [Clostridia bacterium]|nr:TIGR03936 family radical SAM-associated protein [Clostridia bacterium]